MPLPPPTPDLSTRPATAPGLCFELHRGRVYRWAAAHDLNHHQRLDIVQDTFARLLQSRPHFPSEAAQLAWLRRVASNLCVDLLRRPARRTTAISEAISDSLQAPVSPEPADHTLLKGSFASLSEMQRLVLLAKCLDNHTFAEIAAQLNIAIPTAKTHYLRALESLRSTLSPEYPERSATRSAP